MKKDFLFELLTQEMPYKFIPSAILYLEGAFKNLFKENFLEFDAINVYATPRRLAVFVQNLETEQKTFVKDVKGPILNVAKNPDGTFSNASIGFAKKNNVDISSLYEKDNYIWAHSEIKGKNTKDILKENLEKLILKMQGSHFMRWGYNNEKFSRPIESIVALLDNEIIDLKIIDKVASNKTQGHRYSSNRNLTIDYPKNYIEILKSGNVFVNQDERRELIIKLARECALQNNLEIRFEDNMEDLLEEVTYITEYPVAVLCSFDEKYLQVPDIVTTTVMTVHQRYFPLWDKQAKLSNKFITMANYVGDDFSNIEEGNKRVISARLEDGVFFYQEDTKTKLINKLENLKGMTFQKGLGTIFDKTQRMIKLSDMISDMLKIQDKTDILRCATLSKCDLSTKLVFEFTELQGFIGQSYAEFDGENKTVSKGICEHYFPLGANSELPSEITGQIVSLADKIDTINALFISTQGDKKKKRPTGSNDPLGARRAAIGILRTVIENKLNLNIQKVIEYSLKLLSDEFSIPLEDCIIDEIKDFYIQRLLVMYEREFSFNIINSILNFNPLEDIFEFINRAKTLTESLKEDSFQKTKENATRVFKILKDKNALELDEKLFVLPQEKELYSAILAHNTSKDELKTYIKSLENLNSPVVNFFDKVLVMDKDEKIKNNRIALLALLKEKYSAVCDFEKL